MKQKDAALHADHYVHTLAKEQDAYVFEGETRQGLEHWQVKLRQELSRRLGIPAIKSRRPEGLTPEFKGQVQLEDHIREEWSITSEPGYQVPFYVLRPLNLTGKSPLVITPHGHGKEGKNTYVGIYPDKETEQKALENERDIALQAVREGYVVMAPDQRAFASTRLTRDIKADQSFSCHKMQLHALLFGRTLIGERVWDISRLIDYASTRLDVDMSRIAITGNSGGGTTSLFAAALDPRITVAVPGSYFCTFEASIASIDHCTCNYVPGLMQLGEMHDIAGLIAPRAFLAVHGEQDPIYPIAGTRHAFAKLRRYYEVADAADRCELYVGEGGHRYYKARVWDFIRSAFAEVK